MDITILLIFGVLNILLLAGLFIWLLVRLPKQNLLNQLQKEEQTARHADIKTTLASTNERLVFKAT
jgi:hypothetical protein